MQGAVGHSDRGVEACGPRDVDHGASGCGDQQAVDLDDLVGSERRGVHVHALADPSTGAPVAGAVDAVERQPPRRQAVQHRGRYVGKHPVRGLALVAHGGEQGVPDLEPRWRPRGRQVGAPADPDELSGPPLTPQLVVRPPCGEQLPTHDETRIVHGGSIATHRSPRAGMKEFATHTPRCALPHELQFVCQRRSWCATG